MDNNQNMGQPMENQGFVQPQQTYDQLQMNYGQPQQMYGQQPQMQYQNMQQGYGQPQQEFGQQQQMQYQNMQQGFSQPQQMYGQQPQYQNVQQGYMQPQQPSGPKKPLNKKAIAIIAAVLVVAVLAIIFIPKLLKGSTVTPFDDLKMGMSMKEVAKALDIEPEFDEDTWYKRDLEAFGAVGRLQIIFDYEDGFDHANWYVDREDCESSKAYDNAIEEIKEYYTDKYGEPEYDKEENEYSWELSLDREYELEIDEDEFVLRYR